MKTRATRMGALVTVVTAAALLSIISVPREANAFGNVPLGSMSVQLHDHHAQLFLTNLDPAMLSPTGLARWIARSLTPTPSLEVIEWTVDNDTTFERVSTIWGVPKSRLIELNPDLELVRDTELPAGTQLVIYRQDLERPTRSIGRPNRGRLANGMPVPEGPYWMLRDIRRRHFGSELTITNLVNAFMIYGQTHPDGPKIRVGELSKRQGNKIKPHRSHRSGRDADILYVGRNITDADGPRTKVDHRNLDAEKQWTLVKAILDTDDVDYIFMDRRIQQKLSKIAAEELSDEELAKIFEFPRRPDSHRAVIQHWSGHHRHMHVRFRCEDGNYRCRGH